MHMHIYCFMQPDDFWFSAPRKGIMVFALPGEKGLTELSGDFKIHFHDRHGDFYWCVTVLSQNYTFSEYLTCNLRYLCGSINLLYLVKILLPK